MYIARKDPHKNFDFSHLSAILIDNMQFLTGVVHKYLFPGFMVWFTASLFSMGPRIIVLGELGITISFRMFFFVPMPQNKECTSRLFKFLPEIIKMLCGLLIMVLRCLRLYRQQFIKPSIISDFDFKIYKIVKVSAKQKRA